jgi:hypothetical protein
MAFSGRRRWLPVTRTRKQWRSALDEEQGAALPHGDVKGRCHHVGPLWRHGADNTVVDAQQQSPAEAVPAFADAHKRAAGERMEGMGYADKLWRGSGNVCIPG